MKSTIFLTTSTTKKIPLNLINGNKLQAIFVESNPFSTMLHTLMEYNFNFYVYCRVFFVHKIRAKRI